MRVVVQKVSAASVRVEDTVVASIETGFLVLAGVAVGDDRADVDVVAAKLAGLRVFSDDEGRMNLGPADVGGGVLLVSQFTLLGDLRKGRRPSFANAAPPEVAQTLISGLATSLRERGLTVSEGVFGAKMEVESVNDGPVTLVLEVEEGVIR